MIDMSEFIDYNECVLCGKKLKGKARSVGVCSKCKIKEKKEYMEEE